jgi:UDP-N-acetylmuramoyl-L-alanyl-D-glutamate--2,6-diaminopimelate ligase
MASAEDVVLIAGKGHETYQLIGTEKKQFDDREAATKALASRPQG